MPQESSDIDDSQQEPDSSQQEPDLSQQESDSGDPDRFTQEDVVMLQKYQAEHEKIGKIFFHS